MIFVSRKGFPVASISSPDAPLHIMYTTLILKTINKYIHNLTNSDDDDDDDYNSNNNNIIIIIIIIIIITFYSANILENNRAQ